MFVSYISFYLCAVINMSNIALSIFYFPKIVDWLESIHWDYIHRSMDIPYIKALCNSSQFRHITMPNSSILVAKADEFEKENADKKSLNAVNYYVEKDEREDEILRETQKIRQSAYFDELNVEKQNFKAWASERMIERPKEKGKEKTKMKLRRRR